MGAQFSVDGKIAVVEGVDHLNAAPIKATDLRAGAAMVIAGLCAHGVTDVEEIQHIERGLRTWKQSCLLLEQRLSGFMFRTIKRQAKLGNSQFL